MRKSLPILTLLYALGGCSQPPSERPPMPRPGASAPKMTVEEIGKSSFGTAYQSARKEGDTAEFVLLAPVEGTPAERFRRTVMLISTALPTTMRNEPDVKRFRFTAVDAAQPTRKLVVFTLGEKEAKSVGGHGSPEALVGLVKIESADPEFKPALPRKGA